MTRFNTAVVLILLVGLSGCGSHVYHQVRTGDTLYSISWRYSQSYENVANWNGIPSPYVISQGQWLRIAPPPVDPFPLSANSRNHAIANEKQTSKSGGTNSVGSISTSSKPFPVISAIVNSPEKASSSGQLAWQWPLRGEVSKEYVSNSAGKSGIAIRGHLGDVVRAAAAGKVVYSGNSLKGYGNLIIVKHNDKFLSAYGNNQQNLVEEGDFIEAGQVIGRLGRSESGAVELYFEIRSQGKPSNPLGYLPKGRS